MDIVDFALIAVLALAAIHGWRVGALAQVLTFGGLLAGLGAGSLLVSVVEPHVNGGVAKTAVAIGIVLVLAAIGAGVGREASIPLSVKLKRIGVVARANSGVGAVVASAGTLVICWVFASVMVNIPLGSFSVQIENSKILSYVESILPPIPNQFSTVDRYLVSNGFPQVLVNALPQPTGPIELPNNNLVARLARGAASSTVKVVATGCPGLILEGSGFVTSEGLVITNAHVIAGTTSITLELRNGDIVRATPVLFDPKLDIAVLRPDAHLDEHPLVLDPNDAERGNKAVILGYPNGGPLRDGGAGIVSRFVAEGRDIYDESITSRVVYELDAIVRQGNSGGPLIAPSGEVIGVVFSRSTTNPNIGYALASPRVLEKLDLSLHRFKPVSTESCVSG